MEAAALAADQLVIQSRRCFPSGMKECPDCRKLFDPEPTSGEFYPDGADAIRDEFGLCALLRRM